MTVALLTDSPTANATLQFTRDTLAQFAVPFEEALVDTPTELHKLITSFESAGVAVFVVANTTPTPLSAAVAARTSRPVLAIPIATPETPALDALQSTAQAGPPVGTLAIGKAGATNAALLAVAILANRDDALREKLAAFRESQTAKVLALTLT